LRRIKFVRTFIAGFGTLFSMVKGIADPCEKLYHLTMKKYLVAACVLVVLSQCSKNTGVGASGSSSGSLSVGASAHDFLSVYAHAAVNIQIQYAPGMQFQQQSISNLVAFLQAHLNKPGGISVTQTQVNSVGKPAISAQDAQQFEQQNRTVFTSGNTIGVYILAADAAYTTPGVGGLAYLNTSIVVLEQTVQNSSGGINQASRVKVESGILEHEFGHLLGLVNIGTAMVTPHEDQAHTPHCNNPSCLMYYEIETGGLLGAFNNTVPALDDNCENDLRANGGK
jgi:hypothetical protein